MFLYVFLMYIFLDIIIIIFLTGRLWSDINKYASIYMIFLLFYSVHIPSKYLIVMLRATVELVFVFTVCHYL